MEKRNTAGEVYTVALKFLGDAKELLSRLEKKND
jgi:hypothetical protein